DHGFRAIFVITSYDEASNLKVIGNGFVFAPDGHSALAITAAHNIDAIRTIQIGPPLSHPTLPPMFAPPVGAVKLDQARVRAWIVSGDHLEPCMIDWVYEDSGSDLAICALRTQSEESPAVFEAGYDLASTVPSPGDTCHVIGYQLNPAERRPHSFAVSHEIRTRKVWRAGRVIHTLEHGYLHSKGRGIRTT
ncbi:unnamed protein product, partial [Chrysoparadoxa australica]